MTKPCYTVVSVVSLALALTQAAHANDFPTRARVEFVLDCMRSSKAPAEEAM